MRHGISIAIRIYMGDLILGAILQYMVSASVSCFLWSVKGELKEGEVVIFDIRLARLLPSIP